MSNYSSLSRVLSPFQVQTKSEENTLPASYTTDIMAFCFVVGILIESTFEVTGQAEMSISALRELIYDKNKNYFEEIKVDANKLNLWKVDIPGDVENVKLKKLERRSHDINDENITIQELGGEKLTPFKYFGDIFACSRSKNIRIIAQPPHTTGKRRLEDSGEENGNPKKEKLWQKDMELVLNLIKNLPDTNEKVFTVPALPGDDTDTVIYNRSCYGYLRDYILEDELLNRYCITGNPGIGKSYFGRLMLVELLRRQKSVLIDYEGFTAWIEPDGSVLKIKDEDRSTYRQVVGQENVWCIIDSLMPKFNHDLTGKFIMVSSPKKQVIEKFTKAQKSKKFYMPTWDINELYECQEKLYKEVDRDLIGKKFELCGGIARWIFDTAMTSNDIKLIIRGAISDNNLRSMLRSQGELFSGDEFSHKLIHIKSDNETEIPYTKAECVFASQFVEDECLKRFQKNHIEDLRAFIEDSKNIAEMSVLRGKCSNCGPMRRSVKGGYFKYVT